MGATRVGNVIKLFLDIFEDSFFSGANKENNKFDKYGISPSQMIFECCGGFPHMHAICYVFFV